VINNLISSGRNQNLSQSQSSDPNSDLDTLSLSEKKLIEIDPVERLKKNL
jgi:hypothetical protein